MGGLLQVELVHALKREEELGLAGVALLLLLSEQRPFSVALF